MFLWKVMRRKIAANYGGNWSLYAGWQQLCCLIVSLFYIFHSNPNARCAFTDSLLRTYHRAYDGLASWRQSQPSTELTLRLAQGQRGAVQLGNAVANPEAQARAFA